MDFSKALNRLGEAAIMREDGADYGSDDIGAAFQKFSVVTKELSNLMKNLVRRWKSYVCSKLDSILLFCFFCLWCCVSGFFCALVTACVTQIPPSIFVFCSRLGKMHSRNRGLKKYVIISTSKDFQNLMRCKGSFEEAVVFLHFYRKCTNGKV